MRFGFANTGQNRTLCRPPVNKLVILVAILAAVALIVAIIMGGVTAPDLTAPDASEEIP